MSEFLKMDVFFAVTTLAVIVVATFVAIALFYIVRILRNVEHVSERVSEESDLIREDLVTLRKEVRAEGAKWKHFSSFFGRIVGRASGRTSKKRGER